MEEREIKKAVRDSYAKVATEMGSCCGPAGCGAAVGADIRSKAIGYTEDDLSAAPDGANMGLGCGNPVALSSLKEGETVLDLGSGPGLDCFLAASKVGPGGQVIGVDMTPQMLDKARANAAKGGYTNVEFRMGELEHLPVADGEVDVVISNCVINLVPDKKKTFGEAYRALKPGGRLAVSDMVLLGEWPQEVPKSIQAYAGCLAGAVRKDEYLAAVKEAGFDQVEVVDEVRADELLGEGFDELVESPGFGSETRKLGDSLAGVADIVASIKVAAVKPG